MFGWNWQETSLRHTVMKLVDLSYVELKLESIALGLNSNETQIGRHALGLKWDGTWTRMKPGSPVYCVPCLATKIFLDIIRLLVGHNLSKKVWHWKVTQSRSNGASLEKSKSFEKFLGDQKGFFNGKNGKQTVLCHMPPWRGISRSTKLFLARLPECKANVTMTY